MFSRDYLMYYRGPGFYPSYNLAPSLSPTPFPVSKLSLFLNLPVCRPSSFLTGEGGGGEAGDKSYDDEKACSSKNHSILSAGWTGMNHQSCGHDGREGVLLAHHQLLVLVRDVTLQWEKYIKYMYKNWRQLNKSTALQNLNSDLLTHVL